MPGGGLQPALPVTSEPLSFPSNIVRRPTTDEPNAAQRLIDVEERLRIAQMALATKTLDSLLRQKKSGAQERKNQELERTIEELSLIHI